MQLLLDEGRYLPSQRTMHRILAQHSEMRERRNQLTHPVYKRPGLDQQTTGGYTLNQH